MRLLLLPSIILLAAGASEAAQKREACATGSHDCADGLTCVVGHCRDLGGRLCGNGIVDPGEECDAGGTAAQGGCTSTCAVAPGWRCTGQPSRCVRAVINLRVIEADAPLRADPSDDATVVTRLPLGALLDIKDAGAKSVVVSGKTERWLQASFPGADLRNRDLVDEPPGAAGKFWEGWVRSTLVGRPERFKRVTSFHKAQLSGGITAFYFRFIFAADGSLLFCNNFIAEPEGGKCPKGMVASRVDCMGVSEEYSKTTGASAGTEASCYVKGWLTRAGSLYKVIIEPRWAAKVSLTDGADHEYFIIDAHGKLSTIAEGMPVFNED